MIEVLGAPSVVGYHLKQWINYLRYAVKTRQPNDNAYRPNMAHWGYIDQDHLHHLTDAPTDTIDLIDPSIQQFKNRTISDAEALRRLTARVGLPHNYAWAFLAAACNPWQTKRKDTSFMISGKRFAAVDIGSNAVRLLLSEVFESDSGPHFRKISLIRMPIRLGKDAFILGKISPDNADRLLDTIQGFKSLVSAYRPLGFRACATSAMRESGNGEKIRKQILSQTGVDIQIIHGKEEARIIFANNPKGRLAGDNFWLFVDVGGGSTEITIYSDGQSVSRSFGIGTIRLLENLVKRSQWEDLESWISKHTRNFSNPEAVGSGGNINTIIKMAQCKADRTITYDKMKKVRNHLNFFSYDDRITKLGLKPDRADVIMPALKIYMSVMKWGGIGSIAVPQIGLADGMVRIMYRQHLRSKKKKKPLFSKK